MLELLAGELIVTVGGVLSRVTLTTAVPVLLAASLQATVIAFAPATRLTVAGLVAAEPLTVQPVTPTLSVAVHVTEVVAFFVIELLAGAVIVTTGGVTSGPLGQLTVV